MSKHVFGNIVYALAPTTISAVAGVLTIDCDKRASVSRLKVVDTVAKQTMTLAITNAVAGCRGNLTLKQTVAGTITITLPANSAGKLVEGTTTKTLTIFGEANENHYIQFELIDGTYQFRTNFYSKR